MTGNFQDFLSLLSDKRVRVELVQDRLSVNAPDGVLDDQLKNELRRFKPDLIALLQQNSDQVVSVLPDLKNRDALFPLTDVQYAYWLGRGANLPLCGVSTHMFMEYAPEGLDPVQLESALNQVISRHGMLRVVITEDGQQHILPKAPHLLLNVVDCRQMSEKDAQDQLEALRNELSHQVIPLGQWPLFDIRLCLLPEGGQRLFLSLDALSMDAAGLYAFLNDWARAYAGASLAPETDLSFRDYVLAEKQRQESAEFRRHEQYWENRLDSLPDAPHLPYTRALTDFGTSRFERRRFILSSELWSGFQAHAKKHGMSASSALLTAYCCVLAKWSSTQDFCVNVTLFNRANIHPDVETLIGDFTSLILLETHLEGDISFMDSGARVQRQLHDDLDHNLISGVEVIRRLNVHSQRAPGQTSMPIVFTSAIGLTGRGAQVPELFGPQINGLTQTPQATLDNQVFEEGGRLIVNWDSVQDAFLPDVLDHMFDAYEKLVTRLATKGQAWVGRTGAVLSPPELPDMAQTQDQSPVARVLHEGVLKWAHKTPKKAAVIAPDRVLTYDELMSEALAVTAWLDAQGVGVGDRVAIIMHKGWAQSVAVLGVLLCGAAYVPISASQPDIRIATTLNEADPKALLVAQSDQERCKDWSCSLPCVDPKQCAPVSQARRNTLIENCACVPASLAYIIFTSGSTGKPKGVSITHRAAMTTIEAINERCELAHTDRIFGLSSLSFDLSVYDLFGAWDCGAALVLPDEKDCREPLVWAEMLDKYDVTIWNTVPALMRMFADHLEHTGDQGPGRLSHVLLSGDWIPLSLPDRIRALWPEARITGMGGATEAAIWSIAYDIDEVKPEWKSIPYGRPLPRQNVVVLDRDLRRCPVWVEGDIHISGAGLAEGYWRRPDLTERFFYRNSHSGERLYYTGDRGRYMPDGTIEFLGRSDHQVQVNGHRVELGEIETTLSAVEGVANLVANMAGDQTTGTRVVAYVQPDNVKLISHSSGAEADDASRAAQSVHAEALELDFADGLIADETERLEFKTAGHQLWHADGTSEKIVFGSQSEEALTPLYWRRQSHRSFEAERVAPQQLETLLACLRAVKFDGVPLAKYRYGSAGSLYPVQCWISVRSGGLKEIRPGLYYYNPVENALVRASDQPLSDTVFDPGNRDVYAQSAFAILLVAKRAAIEPMYGAFWRDFCLLEAGSMVQLLQETAADVSLGLCQMGRVATQSLMSSCNLSPDDEVLTSLVGGNVAQDKIGVPSAFGQSAGAGWRDIEHSLRLRAEESLPDYMRPVQYIPLTDIPLSTNGKVDRKALPEPQNFEKHRIAPRTLTEWRVAQVWQEILELEDVGVTDSFFETGASSITAVRLVGRLQDVFDIRIPVSELLAAPTIEKVAELIDNTADRSHLSLGIVTLKQGQGTPTVFIHPVGGGLLSYQSLIDQTDFTGPVYGIQHPLLGEEEGDCITVEVLSEQYCADLSKAVQDGPLTLVGWSFGGIVARHMAKNLRENGQEVQLVLIDSHAPSLENTEQVAQQDDDVLKRMVRDFGRIMGADVDLEDEVFSGLSQDEKYDRAQRVLRRALPDLDGISLGEFKKLFCAFQSNTQAKARYTPCSLGGDMTILRAQTLLPEWQDATGLRAVPLKSRELGWAPYSDTDTITVIDIPGDHYSILQSDHVASLRAALEQSFIARNRLEEEPA